MRVDPRAGKPAEGSDLVSVPRLMRAYYTRHPDQADPAQRVAFGTSGHRGSALDGSFNEDHILATTQAICDYRRQAGTAGPLFLGADTHALSDAALASALEVLAGNGVNVLLDQDDGYTPTPVISHAILTHNRSHPPGMADGIVVTPSHNPPRDGGFKYNPPHGGPAGGAVTDWIQGRANALLAAGLREVRRMPFDRASRAGTTRRHEYMNRYIDDLPAVVDLEAIRQGGVSLGVDPLGGAGVRYWGTLAERYGVPITVVSDVVDPTFRFMTLDWDGQIRMDCSSPYAMQRLIALKERFDVAWACDTDHDRHGIVTRDGGLLPPNHYLSAAVAYLFAHRPGWPASAGIGKTVVSTSLIDRLAAQLKRSLVEVPVGFKWFVDGLHGGTIAFAGEESAGASLLRRDGAVWTTDKDGLALGLLAAEMTVVTGKTPSELYAGLAEDLGAVAFGRIDARATPAEQAVLRSLTPARVTETTLGGDPITARLSKAPGNGADIGGLKLVTAHGWCVIRPSGTEEVYKLYAESFRGEEHLARIQAEAGAIVRRLLGAGGAA